MLFEFGYYSNKYGIIIQSENECTDNIKEMPRGRKLKR